MNKDKNYLTQVVILFLLTIGILFGLSTIEPTDINFTIKEIDMLSSLRNQQSEEEFFEEDPVTVTAQAKDSVPFQRNLNVPRKAGDITLIEDYTMTQSGMQNLEKAIKNSGNMQRPVRIAMLGDSFIEADILTQDIRQLLQDMYGGCGVGYVPMHSDFPGFRHSVSHACSGWKTHNVASDPQFPYTSLTIQLHRPQGSAFTRFTGVNKLRHIDSWEVSKIGFIASANSTITVKTDSAQHTYNVTADEKAQFIVVPEPTHSLEVRCGNPNIAFWGAWLDGAKGIAVDNFAMRSYSGTSLTSIPVERMKQLNEGIPYDLILIQYGLNRMIKSVSDYSDYSKKLVEIVAHLREAFPNTDIMIVGISDRTQNTKGTQQTMKAVYGLRKAQREAAIEAQCHFWDCCEAMKTLGGMPAFVEKKWANKDYTHISHAGGKPLAEEFIKALKYALGIEVPTAPQTPVTNE